MELCESLEQEVKILKQTKMIKKIHKDKLKDPLKIKIRTKAHKRTP